MIVFVAVIMGSSLYVNGAFSFSFSMRRFRDRRYTVIFGGYKSKTKPPVVTGTGQRNNLDVVVLRKCPLLDPLSPWLTNNPTLMQTSSISAVDRSWRILRGLTPCPSFLPPVTPPKSTIVDYAQFPAGCSDDEASTRFSAFLFAKTITSPQDPGELLHAYAKKLSLPPLSTPEFRSALSNYLLPTFRYGWDKYYEHQVKMSVLSSGKTVEGIKACEWDLPYSDFHSFCMGLQEIPAEAFKSVKEHKLVAVADSGKYRLVTLGSKWMHLLAPLHRLIYSRLTSKGTTLRGSPLPSTFSDFPFSSDPIISGDYEASTDNLSSAHALHILRDLRSRSKSIPSAIWDLAEESLTGWLTYVVNGVTYRSPQETGQLMGNYLSFPLLCISNISTLFLAFGCEEAWRLINKRLVVVNGDDIVFRSSGYEKWKECLPLSGFIMNPRKTGIHHRLFTLNSKLFKCMSTRVKKLWHLIPKGVFKKIDITKKADDMLAHAAVVRENVRGIPGKMYEKTVRALVSVKKECVRRTGVKDLAGLSEKEYRSWPKKWKLYERIKAYESMTIPKKEKMEGNKVWKISWDLATVQERKDSKYVAAQSRFNLSLRETVAETNDRRVGGYDLRMALDFLCQKLPNYKKREEESVVWVTDPVRRSRDDEFDDSGWGVENYEKYLSKVRKMVGENEIDSLERLSEFWCFVKAL
jgi:hypothetical protein